MSLAGHENASGGGEGCVDPREGEALRAAEEYHRQAGLKARFVAENDVNP